MSELSCTPGDAERHLHRPTSDADTWWFCRRHHLEVATPYGRVRVSTSDVEHTRAHLPAGWVIAS